MSNQRSVQGIRDYQNAWMAHELAAEREREERTRVAAEAKQAAAHQQSLNMQNAQRQWKERQVALKDHVVTLQQSLSAAEGRMLSADMDEACRAAGEAEVYRARLAQAQNLYANHMTQQPL